MRLELSRYLLKEERPERETEEFKARNERVANGIVF